MIPWDELAVGYYTAMSSELGRPCKDARLVIGAVILKHKLNLSDEETVLQIQENPYLQYFVGFSRYKDEQPFAPSLLVEIRKRMGADVFACFERVILERIGMAKNKAGAEPGGDDPEESPLRESSARARTVTGSIISGPDSGGLQRPGSIVSFWS